MVENEICNNLEVELRKILRRFKPSQLDEQLLTACPFYEPENKELASAYRLIHDIAKSRLLAKLQLKLSEIAVASEVPLEFGCVDGVAGSRVGLTNGDNDVAFIEIKTGRTKLVQPAIYTFLSGTKTLVVDLRSGDVLTIDVRTAERIVDELVAHLKDKEKLRELGKRVPGAECWYCRADCEHKRDKECGRRRDGNPLKALQLVLGNIDAVVDGIVAEVLEDVRGR
ncbi:hypothetical protein DRP04_05335 [Archaeoglobales archaeon]|nr:MAG: hypothetical protein DRP04_05335 [Archaeoglobales archaeon]